MEATVKHEDWYIAGAVTASLGSLFMALAYSGFGSDSAPSPANQRTCDTYGVIGIAGLTTSLTYLISRKAFNTRPIHSLIIGGVLSAAIIGYLVYEDSQSSANQPVSKKPVIAPVKIPIKAV